MLLTGRLGGEEEIVSVFIFELCGHGCFFLAQPLRPLDFLHRLPLTPLSAAAAAAVAIAVTVEVDFSVHQLRTGEGDLHFVAVWTVVFGSPCRRTAHDT